MHCWSYTELQGKYHETALATALLGTIHYVPDVLFQESDYSLC